LNGPASRTIVDVSEPFREGRSVGCGAVIGFVIGLNVAAEVTKEWARPGVWYEWPAAITVIALFIVAVGWAVGRGGSTAVAILVSVFSWCM
jgi:hypothetical protein